MRVAFVVPEIHFSGGTERSIASLITQLCDDGHDITAYASRLHMDLQSRVTWRRVPMLKRPHTARFASFFVASAALRAWDRLRGVPPYDVLHSTGPDVLGPTVATFHCSVVGVARDLRAANRFRDGVGRWLRRIVNTISYTVLIPLERYVVRHGAKCVVAVSPTLADELATYHSVPRARIAVIANGVDLERFAPRDGIDEDTPKPLGAFRILFVGHNWERKGLLRLASSAAEVRDRLHVDIHVTAVGGPEPPWAEPAVRAILATDVTILGRRDDVALLYGDADLLALPTQYEAFGMPVLEAMACGVPALVSRCAGVSSLIEDGVNGYVVEDPFDEGEIARTIERAMADDRPAVGARAREKALQYSWRHIAQGYEALYIEASLASNMHD